jgi:hypothetical protein
MNLPLRRIGAAAAVTGALAFAAVGCGGASAEQATPAASTQQAPAAGQGQGGADLAALAKKLGVTEAKLRAAMEATRPSGAPPQAGAPTGQS